MSDDAPEIDTANPWLIGTNGRTICPSMPIMRPLTPNQALVTAAWMVVMAEHAADYTFEDALAAVEAT